MFGTYQKIHWFVYLDLLWPSELEVSLPNSGPSVQSPNSGLTDNETLSTLLRFSAEVDATRTVL